MASIPQSDKVFQTEGLWVPLVMVKNILILPGVPSLFQKMLDSWMINHLPSTGLIVNRQIRRQIKTFWKESKIAAILEYYQNMAAKHLIEIGSYPKLFPDGSTFVVVSVIGNFENKTKIDEITEEIMKEIEGSEWKD